MAITLSKPLCFTHNFVPKSVHHVNLTTMNKMSTMNMSSGWRTSKDKKIVVLWCVVLPI